MARGAGLMPCPLPAILARKEQQADVTDSNLDRFATLG